MLQIEKITLDLDSEVLGAPVPTTVILPPGYAAASEPLPLFIELHGAGGDRDWLDPFMPTIDDLFTTGTLPPAVLVTISAGPLSFYLGELPRFIAEELPALMANAYRTRTDRDGVVLTGTSMGGHAALKIALCYPERFAAIAALEPAIEPAFEPGTPATRNTWYLEPSIAASLWGAPIDVPRWQADHAPNIARANAEAIRDSGLAIYLECGDEDQNNLHDGAEFLHRVLWDFDIRHEYHLVRWAHHMGPSMPVRMAEAHGFLAAAVTGKRRISTDLPATDSETAFLEWTRKGIFEGEPMPEGFSVISERAPSMHASLTQADREQAAANDPAMARAYAQLPPTD